MACQVILVFSSLTWLLVGSSTVEFSTLESAWKSVTRISLGESENFYPQILAAQPTVGPVVVVLYQVLGIVLLLNVVIAILLEVRQSMLLLLLVLFDKAERKEFVLLSWWMALWGVISARRCRPRLCLCLCLCLWPRVTQRGLVVFAPSRQRVKFLFSCAEQLLLVLLVFCWHVPIA